MLLRDMLKKFEVYARKNAKGLKTMFILFYSVSFSLAKIIACLSAFELDLTGQPVVNF